MNRERLSQPFSFVANERSSILILGSFPSIKSRESGFYYGHPQNRFWRMLAGVYDQATPLTVEQKKHMLLSHGLALWDAAQSCLISASSDSSLTQAIPANLSLIFSVAPIRAVLCNGATAYSLYARFQEKTSGIPGVKLPSTSPANAAYSLERLIHEWKPHLLIASQP